MINGPQERSLIVEGFGRFTCLELAQKFDGQIDLAGPEDERLDVSLRNLSGEFLIVIVASAPLIRALARRMLRDRVTLTIRQTKPEGGEREVSVSYTITPAGRDKDEDDLTQELLEAVKSIKSETLE